MFQLISRQFLAEDDFHVDLRIILFRWVGLVVKNHWVNINDLKSWNLDVILNSPGDIGIAGGLQVMEQAQLVFFANVGWVAAAGELGGELEDHPSGCKWWLDHPHL